MRLVFLVPLCLLSTCLGASPQYNLPMPQDEQLAWVKQNSSEGQRIAAALSTDLHSTKHGVWRQLGDQRVWQLSLHAGGAQSLGFQIDALGWPDQARLLLRDSDGQRQQLLTTLDLVGNSLWTAQFPGDSVQLELSMPLNEQGELRIGNAYYGTKQNQHKHGNCNVDVVCPNNQDAVNQIDSTVLLQYTVPGGLSVCSGFLVNNMRQDGAPYILTADHCQINRSVQNSVRVYWQFQDDQCGNAPGHAEGDPRDFSSIGGVEVLAEGQDSDFTLLVLGSAENPTAIPTSFAPYWSGWNVSATPAQSGLSVHHPNGDEKSISRFSQTLLAVREDIDGRPTDSWQVMWDSGTTQPGSSGSGLWNSNGQAVGVLSGGGASCSSQDAPDFYGRLNRGWEEGASCDRQLKFWLDPDGIGVESMNGRSKVGASPRIPACSGSPTPTATPGAGGGGSGSVPPLMLIILLMGLAKKASLGRVKL